LKHQCQSATSGNVGFSFFEQQTTEKKTLFLVKQQKVRDGFSTNKQPNYKVEQNIKKKLKFNDDIDVFMRCSEHAHHLIETMKTLKSITIFPIFASLYPAMGSFSKNMNTATKQLCISNKSLNSVH
jgi:hypothetical protein